MADVLVINDDLAGRDIINGNAASVQDIIAAKLKAKREEIEREAAEDAEQGQSAKRGGGVNITGGTTTIGGRVVSGDLFTDK